MVPQTFTHLIRVRPSMIYAFGRMPPGYSYQIAMSYN